MNATTSHILTQLDHIDKIVAGLKSNIVKVNEKVKALAEELAALAHFQNIWLTTHLRYFVFVNHNLFLPFLVVVLKCSRVAGHKRC